MSAVVVLVEINSNSEPRQDDQYALRLAKCFAVVLVWSLVEL
jgi:hypothetical protein